MGDTVYTMGVDIGSTASKAIILENGKKILDTITIDVGAGTSGPSRAINGVLEKRRIKKKDIQYGVGTGN